MLIASATAPAQGRCTAVSLAQECTAALLEEKKSVWDALETYKEEKTYVVARATNSLVARSAHW